MDDLALLLTGGRLNEASRNLIKNSVEKAKSKEDGIRMAQKLIASSPEYQTTNVQLPLFQKRPEVDPPKNWKGL